VIEGRFPESRREILSDNRLCPKKRVLVNYRATDGFFGQELIMPESSG
jgi:hypothetical protein